MGTNYYVRAAEPCAECGRPFEAKHIGKSSLGWYFALHIYPEDGLDDLPDWQVYWANKVIEDEYGRRLSPEEMLAVITERQRNIDWNTPPDFYPSWAEFHAANHSEGNPNRLVRSRVDGQHCIGHGAGTWDLFTGDFC